MNNNIANEIANGGTIPPAITAAITADEPDAKEAVPKTYAALLIGPPISTAIMAPNKAPNNNLDELPILFNPSVIMVFN